VTPEGYEYVDGQPSHVQPCKCLYTVRVPFDVTRFHSHASFIMVPHNVMVMCKVALRRKYRLILVMVCWGFICIDLWSRHRAVHLAEASDERFLR
jgi:hypothetical protein